jgi:demethylmenaquinone methyltransferase / 2-methoxy-6-polyprenyl-1,4-benzoquinol methylase
MPSDRTPLMPNEALPTGEAKVRAVRGMFDAIAPRYDLVNRVMTFGLDRGWRRRAVRALALPAGSAVLDLAAGTGDLCRDLQRAGHRPTGVDLSWGMLAAARTTAPLVQADVTRLPVPDGRVDGATCGFALRNLADLDAFLAELARVVRPGGRVAILEVSEPDSALLRWGHGVYFGKVVPRIGGLLSDRSAYRYLPRSAAYLPPPPELVERFAAAGFPDTTRQPLGAGAAQLLVGTRD